MRSFFRPGRRAMLVLLPVCLIFAASFIGTAKAATPAAGSVGTLNSSTSFQSQFLLPNELQSCPPAPNQNAFCDYYTLTAQSTGQVQACSSFDADIFGMNDIDVIVYDQNGNQIAAGTSTANPECVIFNVTAGQTYTIAINPIFVAGVVNVTTTIQFFPATGGNANGGGSTTTGQGMAMTGGGQTADGGQYALPIFQDVTKGKIKFQKGTACNFRADGHNGNFLIVQLTPNGQGGYAHVEGQGFNNNKAVQFVADIQDNGEPGSSGSAGGPDVFTIQITDSQSGTVVCTGGGQVASGNTQFHPTGV